MIDRKIFQMDVAKTRGVNFKLSFMSVERFGAPWPSLKLGPTERVKLLRVQLKL